MGGVESFLYAGLLGTLAGLASLLRPLRFLGIRTRPRASLVLALGLFVAMTADLLPAPVRHSSGGRLIDRFMPEYHESEVHSILIHAPAERIVTALWAVTPAEIRWLRTLFWIRSLPARLAGRPTRHVEDAKPFLKIRPGSNVLVLEEDPEREVVFGTVGQFWKLTRSPRIPLSTAAEFMALHRPDYAKATFNFTLEDSGAGWHKLTTETRIYTPDPSARRRFAMYWRVIHPGSALLRLTMLSAIKKRAEAPPPTHG